MTPQEAASLVQKMNEEMLMYRLKKQKFKRYTLISIIVGSVFLIAFIIFLTLFCLMADFQAAQILMIVFLVLALVGYQIAIVFHLFSRYVYQQKEEMRAKILLTIEKTVKK